MQQYEDSIKYYRDLKNSLETKFREGKIEGKLEIAKNLLSMGMDIETVEKATGLTKEFIKTL